MLYLEDECPVQRLWGPYKINCCLCGEFSGYVETSYLVSLFPCSVVCEVGYGCRKRCTCKIALTNPQVDITSYEKEYLIKMYRCLECNNIASVIKTTKC